jgi:hypothetical protein
MVIGLVDVFDSKMEVKTMLGRLLLDKTTHRTRYASGYVLNVPPNWLEVPSKNSSAS